MKKVLLLTTLIVLALVQSHSMSMAQSNVENEAKSPEPIVVVDTSQEAKVGITQSEKPAEDAVLSARPIDIMLVLDNSGSMKTNDPHFLTREVVTSFVQDLAPGWRLGMIVFDKGAEIVEPLSELSTDVDRNRFLQNLSRLNYKGQLTNSPAAIEKANYELRTKGRDKARKVIIFLTDGIVDLGNKKQDADKSAWLRESLTKESKQIGIGIHGIAFTDQADFSLIQTLANHTGGQYYRAFKAEEIADTFNQIKDFINKPEPEPQVAAAPSTATSPTLSPSPVPAQPSSAVVQPPPSPPPPPKETFPISILLAALLVIVGGGLVWFLVRSRGAGSPTTGKGSSARTPSGPVPEAVLECVGDGLVEDKFVIRKHTTKIGREVGANDLVISDDTVSAFHASISYDYGKECFYLEDQRSLNGTFLNGNKIEEASAKRLYSGNKIGFAGFTYQFILPGDPEWGKTKLATPSPKQERKTKAWAPGQDQSPVADPPQTPEQPQGSPAGPQPVEPAVAVAGESAGERQTKLKDRMCPNHSSQRATELCPKCQRGFCKRCMVEKNGKLLCSECAEEGNGE